MEHLPLEKEHMESRDTFSKYIYDLHELVNKMLDKKSGLTYEMVRDRYENFRSRCTKSYKEYKKRIKRKTVKRRGGSEKGCTEPLYGEKAKCVLHIVPQTKKTDTFHMDKECLKRKVNENTQ